MSALIADIGGTHIRLARAKGRALADPVRLPVADFPSLEDALARYAGKDKAALYIATAAWPHADGVWRFSKPGRWEIDPGALCADGWQIGWIGNDFGAGARGALAAGPEHLFEVQAAGDNEIAQKRSVVLGSGTGLGLAYVEGARVQETYGGQMQAPQLTDEHHTVIELAGRLKDNGRPVSAEDIISGPGLALLYRACCLLHGQEVADSEPGVMLLEKDSFFYAHPLRLFHEFLGLFAQQAAIFGHAYQGLYLDGGVLHHLVKAQAFDRRTFLDFFIGDPLPLIKDQLSAMKIGIVTDPFVTLRGLLEIMHDA